MPRSSFKLQLFPQSVAAIRFKGILDDALVARAVDECVSRECHGLAVDLSEVAHASSAALSKFLVHRDVVKAKGGRIVFVEPASNVGIVFTMLGLRDVFSMHASLDGALRDLLAQNHATRELQF